MFLVGLELDPGACRADSPVVLLSSCVSLPTACLTGKAFISPLGVFTQVGFNNPFRINLVIDLFAIGGLGLPLLFGMWPVTVIHALWVILARK